LVIIESPRSVFGLSGILYKAGNKAFVLKLFSLMEQIRLEYMIEGGDFTNAGNASSSLK
jgi:hypothetical protein